MPLSDPEIDLPDQDVGAGRRASPSSAGSRPRTPRTSSRPTTAGSRTTARPGGLGIRLDGGPAITGGDHHAVLRLAAGEDLAPAAGGSSTRRGGWSGRSRSSGSGASRRTSRSCSTWSRTPTSSPGDCTTRFLDETPELFRFPIRQDRATRLLTFAAEVTVNGFPGVTRPPGYAAPARARAARVTTRWPTRRRARASGSRRSGPDAFSPLGPRAAAAAPDRHDLPRRPPVAAGHAGPDPRHAPASPTPTPGSAPGSSRSRCGAAPRSTRPCGSSRKTRGSAWPSSARGSPTSCSRCCSGARTRSATRAIPTTSSRRSSRRRPRRGSTCSASSTRSTGCRTWRSSLEAVREAGALCEAAICYTGDILDPGRPKYDLAYYVELAKELEKRGANLIAIKDMAGLCKPFGRRAADQGAARGGRRADPLPHARHRRRAGRQRAAGRRRRASTSPTARSRRCRA